MIVLAQNGRKIVEVKELKIGEPITIALNDSAKLYMDLKETLEDAPIPTDAIFDYVFPIVNENDEVLGKYFQEEEIEEILNQIILSRTEYIRLPKGVKE